MPTISTRAPKLACAAVFAALCLIGWVAKVALAQELAKESAPPPLPEPRAAASSLPQGFDVPKVDTAKAPVPPDDRLSPGPALLGIAPPPTVFSGEAAVEPTAGPTLRGPDDRGPLANESEDPEKAVMRFVEQNQKMAESQLKNLKAEEAKLRAPPAEGRGRDQAMGIVARCTQAEPGKRRGRESWHSAEIGSNGRSTSHPSRHRVSIRSRSRTASTPQ